MTGALKRQVRAAEYRNRASEAFGLATSSLLAHVRDKHQAAALRWNELAALSERDGGDSPQPALGV